MARSKRPVPDSYLRHRRLVAAKRRAQKAERETPAGENAKKKRGRS